MFRYISILLAALLVAPAAFAGGRESCADAVFRGDVADTTALTTTAVPMVFLAVDNDELYDPTGAWAEVPANDFAEWCYTAPDNVESADFKVTWTVDATQSGTTQGVAATVGVDVDATLAAGDEISPAIFHEFTAIADRANIGGFGYTTVQDGGCIGILVDADGGSRAGGLQ
jgi:hypothetical protein